MPAKFDAAIDARTDAVPTQRRRKEEVREVKKVDDGGGAQARDLALDLTEQIATIAGYSDPINRPPSWCGAPMRRWKLAGASHAANVVRQKPEQARD